MRDQPRPGDPARLADLAPEVAAAVVRVAGDIALVIGNDGVIRTVADGRAALPRTDHEWVGKRWADTVSAATRDRAQVLLDEARLHGVSRRSELSHRGAEGSDIPFSWAAVRLGDGGPLLAVGRDMRAVSAIQQRFQETQVSLEREYWRGRDTDSQRRLLYQLAHDAVLVLDAASGQVLDANAAAAALFTQRGQPWQGQALRALVEDSQRALLDEVLQRARLTGAAAEIRLRTPGGEASLDFAASLLGSGDGRHLLVRARPAAVADADMAEALAFVKRTQDAMFVTDPDGRVLWASPAFVALCRAEDESEVRGQSLGALLGTGAAPWATLLAGAREQGLAETARLPLKPARGRGVAVAVSASSLAEGDQERVGFTLRALPGEPEEAEAPADLHVDLSTLQLQLGEAALPELMAEVVRQVERRLIEAALHEGGLAVAARRLRISPAALQQRMEALALAVPGDDGGPPREG